MLHSDECAMYQTLYLMGTTWYRALWPERCPKCHGEGGKTVFDNLAPHGSGTWLCESFEPCECLESGCCPRCGAKLPTDWDYDDDTSVCPECGWQWGNQPYDSEPAEPECECWL